MDDALAQRTSRQTVASHLGGKTHDRIVRIAVARVPRERRDLVDVVNSCLAKRSRAAAVIWIGSDHLIEGLRCGH